MIWKILSVQKLLSFFTLHLITLDTYILFYSFLYNVSISFCMLVIFFLIVWKLQSGSFLVHTMEAVSNSICMRECIHTYTYPRKKEHGVWKDKLIVASNERVCEVNNKEQATPQKNSWTSQDVYLIFLPFRLSEFYTFLNNSKHNVLGSDNGMVVFMYV